MHQDISWDQVTALFAKTRSCAVATVDEDGTPRVSPIGSIILGPEGRGHYLEKFPQAMRRNLDRDPRMSILAVHSGAWLWMGALFRGKFRSYPALRLVCEAGERRQATDEERQGFMAKVRKYRFFKGHDLLWKDMRHVREFTVTRVEPVELGPMNP